MLKRNSQLAASACFAFLTPALHSLFTHFFALGGMFSVRLLIRLHIFAAGLPNFSIFCFSLLSRIYVKCFELLLPQIRAFHQTAHGV